LDIRLTHLRRESVCTFRVASRDVDDHTVQEVLVELALAESLSLR
jgi:hypothetical protein